MARIPLPRTLMLRLALPAGVARHFTGDEIETLVRTAGEVTGGGLTEDDLSTHQCDLAVQVWNAQNDLDAMLLERAPGGRAIARNSRSRPRR